MSAIYGNLIRYGAIVALLGLVLAGVYFKGRSAGVASEQPKTAAEHQARLAAEQMQVALATRIDEQNAAVSAAEQKAKDQQAKAQTLTDQVASERQRADKLAAQWAAKLKAATSKPECHALQEDLCPSVMDY